jgi:3-oxoacyl-[acyl-carrier-protein] synthase-1
LNGITIPIRYFEGEKESWLNAIFRSLQLQYLKFFKMDSLSKAGFLATELIANDLGWDCTLHKKDMAIVCFNHASSLENDKLYQRTIQDTAQYYPSPSVFVYTLPNIVIGEIAIRNKIEGETSFYITESFSAQAIYNAITDVFTDDSVNGLLCGWTSYFDKHCDVLMMYITKNKHAGTAITSESIAALYGKVEN